MPVGGTPFLLIAHCVLFTPQLLDFATDELSIRVGETLAELLNVTLVRISFHFVLLSPHPSAHQSPFFLAG